MYFILMEPERDYMYFNKIAYIKNKADISSFTGYVVQLQLNHASRCKAMQTELIVKFDHQCLQQTTSLYPSLLIMHYFLALIMLDKHWSKH